MKQYYIGVIIGLVLGAATTFILVSSTVEKHYVKKEIAEEKMAETLFHEMAGMKLGDAVLKTGAYGFDEKNSDWNRIRVDEHGFVFARCMVQR